MDAKFLPLLKILKNFFVWQGFMRYESKMESVIKLFFHLYGTVTQKQLQTYSGFSAGYISQTLRKLKKDQIVKATRTPSSREFRYHLLDPALHLEFNFSPQETQIPTIVSDYAKLMTNFTNSSEQYPQQIYESILNRIRDYTQFLEQRWKIIDYEIKHPPSPQTSQSGKEKNPRSNSPLPPSRDIQFPKNPETDFVDTAIFLEHPITPEQRAFEKRLINLFCKNNSYRQYNPTLERILAAFLPRPVVTQPQLGKITGFSPSTISRSLSQLEQIGYIQKIEEKYEDQFVYCIMPVEIIKPSYRDFYFRRMGSYIPNLSLWRDRLIDPKQEFLFSEDFTWLFTLVSRILLEYERLKSSPSMHGY